MAATSDLDRVSMVVLRYMRRPFFALVLVYAVGIIGMSLIPGYDENGDPQKMNLFHSFYFFTYTATTTGFGEIPMVFSDEQRLWAIFCLYTGVIAWLYAIGSIIRLLQNPYFLLALNEYRFTRIVKGISDPFYIICGFGDTGSLLARGLSEQHMRGVIIDNDIERIKALALRDYTLRMPGLCADASNPKHLVHAGIKYENCKAIVILFDDEDINLKIAVMAKFLNPSIQVICRSTTPRYEMHLKELENLTVIDPFEIFAQLLSMSISSPRLHNLNSWLVRATDTKLGQPLNMPKGNWLLCGYGRMGQWIHQYFKQEDIRTTIIDPNITSSDKIDILIQGHADHQTLKQAGIETAAGIVAGTNRDTDNLSILLSARSLNPNIFSIARQNDHEDQLVFDAAHANLTLQPSLTTARRILKTLISPMIQTMINFLQQQDSSVTEKLINRLQQAVGEQRPQLWRVNLCPGETTAVTELLEKNIILTLGDLIRDPHDLNSDLACVPFMIERKTENIMLPKNCEKVRIGDEILFCGTKNGKRMLSASANNPYTLDYLITGDDAPRGYFFNWLAKKTEAKTAQ